MVIDKKKIKNPYLLAYLKAFNIKDGEEIKNYDFMFWIDKKHTEYRNIQFHVDVITFEIATKKSNIKSISSLLENYTKLVQKGFINTFCVLENSYSMFVVKVSAKVDRLTSLNTTTLTLEIDNIKD